MARYVAVACLVLPLLAALTLCPLIFYPLGLMFFDRFRIYAGAKRVTHCSDSKRLIVAHDTSRCRCMFGLQKQRPTDLSTRTHAAPYLALVLFWSSISFHEPDLLLVAHN